MISLLIAALALLAQQLPAQPPAQATTAVEGRVINSLNGEAVPKVTVILRSRDQEHQPSYADETDGSGHFSISDMEAGEYAVLAERPGFITQPPGATGAPPPSVKVEKGQQVKDVTIRLTPLGAITGRVLDADGDPVRDAQVEALVYGYRNGKKELREVEQVQSGDNGNFRLFGLRPGTFYLKATHDLGIPGQRVAATYYPGAADQSRAAPVVVSAGSQLQGFDIRLQPAAAYSVRFKTPEGFQVEGFYNAFLAPEQGPRPPEAAEFSHEGVVFPAVPPGSYEAVITTSAGGKKIYAIQQIEVVNADVDGGTLTFLPGVEVAGSVRVEGGAFPDLARLQIDLQSEHEILVAETQTAEVNPDGSFLAKDVPPLTYQLAINRVPGVYLKSVRMGDKQLADRRIDLASKLEPLIIVLGADEGEVEGSVQNAQGDPVVRARVNVIAYGDHSDRGDFNRFGFSDGKGEFNIKNVPPGEYKVFAWEDVPVGAPQDPEFRKPFEKQAASIKMQPNGHQKVQLTAISASQVRQAQE
jgi:hypothetical protein